MTGPITAHATNQSHIRPTQSCISSTMLRRNSCVVFGPLYTHHPFPYPPSPTARHTFHPSSLTIKKIDCKIRKPKAEHSHQYLIIPKCVHQCAGPQHAPKHTHTLYFAEEMWDIVNSPSGSSYVNLYTSAFINSFQNNLGT